MEKYSCDSARYVRNSAQKSDLQTPFFDTTMADLYKRDQLPLLGWGSSGDVCKVTNRIASKVFVDGLHMVREKFQFELLEQHPPCADIVYSFLRPPNMNFMQFLHGGSLEVRLQMHQIRDAFTRQVVTVKHHEPRSLVTRWLTELSGAAAWLESLGYAHGDIRPSNLLLDGE